MPVPVDGANESPAPEKLTREEMIGDVSKARNDLHYLRGALENIPDNQFHLARQAAFQAQGRLNDLLHRLEDEVESSPAPKEAN